MKPVVTDYRPFAAFLTLFDKEVLRFRKIALHAILAPILTSILYLLVFGEVLKGKMSVLGGVDYVAFLIPGLVMMALLQTRLPTRPLRFFSPRSWAASSLSNCRLFRLAACRGLYFSIRRARTDCRRGRLCCHLSLERAASGKRLLGARLCDFRCRTDG